MATENSPECYSFQAAADQSTKQYYAVKLDTTADRVAVCNGATNIAIGLLQNKPAAAGRAASVAVRGISKAVVDGNAGAISIGDRLGTDGNGKLVKKSSNNDWFIAIALEASTADGDVITVMLLGGGYYGA